MNPHIPCVQSAELPLLHPDVVDLVKMIDEDESYNAIFQRLCNSSLAKAVPLSIDNTEHRILLHSIPPYLLRSLLMGTLGPHFHNPDLQHENFECIYDSRYAGAYAVFFHIAERQGAFLSQRETRDLVKALKRYAAGVKVHDSHTDVDLIPGPDKADLLFTQEIDHVLRNTAWDGSRVERPRFAEPERTGVVEDDDTIMSLIAMFESRCTIDETEDANPDLDKWQLQCPLIIGSASSIATCSIHHLTDNHDSGSGMPKVWALTASCLKHLGLGLRASMIPICVIWEDSQFNPAEVLGMVLASSSLPGNGFNNEIPGTHRDAVMPDAMRKDAENHIFHHKKYFGDNLQRTRRELREIAVADLTEKKATLNGQLEKALQEVYGAADRHKEAVKNAQEVNKKFRRLLDEKQELLTRKDKIKAEMDKIMNEITGEDGDDDIFTI